LEPVLTRVPEVLEAQKKYKKMIVTGNVIEVYEMDQKPYQLFQVPREKPHQEWIEEWEEELANRTLEDRLANVQNLMDMVRITEEHNRRHSANISRTRNMVRRLALANFDSDSKFVTFTFAENIQSIPEANQLWKKFILRLRYKYGGFKYLAVLEFQKRGAVHYHMISDLPYIPKKQLAEIWGQGFIKINRITHVDNVGAYIVKYMTKDLMDERFVSQKAYQCSKGLERPLVLRGEELERIWSFYGLEDKKTVFESSYTSEHHGTIRYREYNLKRI